MKIGDSENFVEFQDNGAYVTALRLSGRDILKIPSDDIYTHGGMAVLAPFANRIRGATYSYNGHQYSLTQNSEGNAIHGFAKESKFVLVERKENEARLQSDLRNAGYPGSLEFTISYSLMSSEFRCRVVARNRSDQKVPFQLGFHPYFLVNPDWSISCEEPVAKLNYVDSYFPDGSATIHDPFYVESSSAPRLDNCYFSPGVLKLSDGKRNLLLVRHNMPYFVLYNGKYADGISVAMEPMSAPPDCFNNKIGLRIISPGEEAAMGFDLKLD